MGQHKTNPNAIAKAKGEIGPKKKKKNLTKKDLATIASEYIRWKYHLPRLY